MRFTASNAERNEMDAKRLRFWISPVGVTVWLVEGIQFLLRSLKDLHRLQHVVVVVQKRCAGLSDAVNSSTMPECCTVIDTVYRYGLMQARIMRFGSL